MRYNRHSPPLSGPAAAFQNAHKPAWSRPAEFKVAEPVALRDLPKPAMQKKIVPTSSESQMETSAVDMFAEHGSRSGQGTALLRSLCSRYALDQVDTRS